MDAFRELVNGARNGIYRLAYDLTGSRDEAEDLSQEAFIKAYRSLGSFRGEARWSTWMYRITMNTYLDVKKNKVRSIMEHRTDMEGHGDDRTVTPDRSAEARLIQEHVEAALGSLTPRERSVFVLRHYHDLPLKHIAETLEISEGTVKALLFRAIGRLQKELAFYRDAHPGSV
jgi:RNA polymerase sigma-70 factor (ECF subfamily)